MNLAEALKALAEGKKIRRDSWTQGYLFLNNENLIVNDLHGECSERLRGGSWEIYEEPKPKVRRYKALYIGDIPFESDNYYKDEEEAKNHSCRFIRLLHESVREFDE